VSEDPVNIVDGVRQSTAIAYLTDEVRSRPNLTIVGDVVVDKVLFDGITATGVISSANEVYPAKEVILSAGTYGSAAILLRSGVGPARDLAELGIAAIADLPVGQRLQDQPIFYNAYALSNEAIRMSPAVGALLWFRSSLAKDDELDLHISATHLLDKSYSPTGGAIVLATAVVLPESVGTLRISSTDPNVAPLIDNNFLATERDQLRMLEAMKTSRRLARGPVFGPLQAGELIPGDAVGDEALPEVIAANLATYGHPTSTVPMGGATDPAAVVDWSPCAGCKTFALQMPPSSPSSVDGHQSDHHHGCRAHLPPGLRAMTTAPPKVGLHGCARTWAIGT
jgi:choline dehydrogenase